MLSTRHLLVGGYNRSFELQVPRNSTGKLPVILSFHGDGGYAASQAADDHFRDEAGAFAIVVHGQGITPRLVSVGGCGGTAAAPRRSSSAWASPRKARRKPGHSVAPLPATTPGLSGSSRALTRTS